MSEKTALQAAYDIWVSHSPGIHFVPGSEITYSGNLGERTYRYPKSFDGSCCGYDHFMDKEGLRVQKPDSSVCDRERSWRDYVRLRDGVS